MTITDAIKELEESKNYPISEPASEEAIDMAIMALMFFKDRIIKEEYTNENTFSSRSDSLIHFSERIRHL